jgi:hypothetical protein
LDARVKKLERIVVDPRKWQANIRCTLTHNLLDH